MSTPNVAPTGTAHGGSVSASAGIEPVVGRYTYGRIEVMRWPTGNCDVTIGSFCSIGFGTFVLAGGEHRTDWVTTHPFNSSAHWGVGHIEGHPTNNGNIVIGNDVWIGASVMVLSGAQIGDGAVVGAGSVVAGKVAPYSIVAGNPLRRVGFRFEQSVIDRLLKIRWWDWDDVRIKRAVPFMLTHEIEKFCRMAEEGRFG